RGPGKDSSPGARLSAGAPGKRKRTGQRTQNTAAFNRPLPGMDRCLQRRPASRVQLRLGRALDRGGSARQRRASTRNARRTDQQKAALGSHRFQVHQLGTCEPIPAPRISEGLGPELIIAVSAAVTGGNQTSNGWSRSVKKQFPISEPMSGPEILLIVLLVLGFAVVVFLLLRQRQGAHNAEILQQLQSLESELRADFTKATADMAARVEQVRGGLQLELADRLQSGLKEFRAEITQGLTRLSGTLQTKFEQLAESQMQSARTARGELAQSLDASTKALQASFEGLEKTTAQGLENIRGKVDERLQAISEHVQAKLEKNIQEGFAHFKAVQEHLKADEEQLRN